jgi:hypothetical protein
MTGPNFSLFEADGRKLTAKVFALEGLYLLHPRDHRPFVRAFIRAVYDVTDHT